ncbi:MAG: putative bifunctional diguanylate cyclase/phosphodiesterase [Bradymonadaceae bacterium]
MSRDEPTEKILDYELVRWFVPDEAAREDTAEAIRARVFVVSVFVLLAMAAPFVYVYAGLFGIPEAATIISVGFVAVCATPFALKWTGRLDLPSHLVALSLYAGIVGISMFTGGIHAPALLWIVAVPIYALSFDDRTGALVWVFVVVGTFVAFYLGESTGNGLSVQRLPEPDVTLLRLLGLIGVTFLLTAVFSLYGRIYERLIERVERLREKFDLVTELPTLHTHREHLTDHLRRMRDVRVRFAMGIVDLDDFQSVNTSLGTSAGDELLARVGGRLEALIRQHDSVARIGDDAFALLFDDVAERPHLEAIAERVVDAFEEPFDIESTEVHVDASAGFVWPSPALVDQSSDESAASRLERAARRCLDRAKEVGGSSYRLREVGMEDSVRDQIALENRIREGIDAGEFTAHFQPIVDIERHERLGFEVLARWEHPDRGVVSPGTFIPVASRSDLITTLSREVLESACRSVAKHRDSLDHVELHFNLSPRQLIDDTSLESIAATLDEHAFALDDFRFEITEQEWHRYEEDIRQWHEEGFAFAIDDFGKGYSSFARFKRLPVEALKLDLEFVQGVVDHETDAGIVRAMVEFGRQVDVPVIAEGVETDEQLAFLESVGCHAAQGYLLGRPAPLETFVAES